MGFIIFLAVTIVILSIIPVKGSGSPSKSGGLPWMGRKRLKSRMKKFWD